MLKCFVLLSISEQTDTVRPGDPQESRRTASELTEEGYKVFPLFFVFLLKILVFVISVATRMSSTAFSLFVAFFFCDNCLAKVVGEEMKTYLSCARIFWCERCKHGTTYSQKSF